MRVPYEQDKQINKIKHTKKKKKKKKNYGIKTTASLLTLIFRSLDIFILNYRRAENFLCKQYFQAPIKCIRMCMMQGKFLGDLHLRKYSNYKIISKKKKKT